MWDKWFSLYFVSVFAAVCVGGENPAKIVCGHIHFSGSTYGSQNCKNDAHDWYVMCSNYCNMDPYKEDAPEGPSHSAKLGDPYKFCDDGIETVCVGNGDVTHDVETNELPKWKKTKVDISPNLDGTIGKLKKQISDEELLWTTGIQQKINTYENTSPKRKFPNGNIVEPSDMRTQKLQPIRDAFSSVPTGPTGPTGIVPDLKADIDAAKEVVQEAASESKEVMNYFTDDAMSQYNIYYANYLNKTINAEEEYNLTNGNFEQDAESTAVSVVNQAEQDYKTIEMMADSGSTSIHETAHLLTDEIGVVVGLTERMYKSSDANLRSLVPFFRRYEDNIQTRATRAISGSSSAESNARTVLRTNDKYVIDKLDQVKAAGSEDMRDLRDSAKNVYAVMRGAAQRFETDASPRLRLIRRGPNSKAALDKLLSPLERTFSTVKEEAEGATDVVHDLDYQYTHAKGMLESAGGFIQRRAELQGTTHRKLLEAADSELRNWDRVKFGPTKTAVSSAYGKGEKVAKQINATEAEMIVGIEQLFTAADAYVDGGFISDPRNLLDQLVNATLSNARAGLGTLQKRVSLAPGEEQVIQTDIDDAEESLDSEKNLTDARVRMVLQEAASYIGSIQRNASTYLEQVAKAAESALSRSYSLQQLPQSHRFDAVRSRLQNAFQALKVDVTDLPPHVEDVIASNSDYAHALYVHEKEQIAKVVGAVLHDTNKNAGAISTGIHAAISKMDTLRSFLEKRTKYGFLGIEHDWDQTLQTLNEATSYLQSDASKVGHEATVAANVGSQLVAGVNAAQRAFTHRIDRVAESFENHVDLDTARLLAQAADSTKPAEEGAGDNIAAVAAAWLNSIAETGADAAEMFSRVADNVEAGADRDRDQAAKDATYLTGVYDDLKKNQLIQESAEHKQESNFNDLTSDVESLSDDSAEDSAQIVGNLEDTVDADEGALSSKQRDSESEVGQKVDEVSGAGVAGLSHLAQSVREGTEQLDAHSKSAEHHAVSEAAWVYQAASQMMQATGQRIAGLGQAAHADAVTANRTIASIRDQLRAAEDALSQAGDDWSHGLVMRVQSLHDLAKRLGQMHSSIADAIDADANPWLAEIAVLRDELVSNMIAKSANIDSLEAAAIVSEKKGASVLKDAQVDTYLAQKANDEAWRLYDARKNVAAQKVFEIRKYIDGSIEDLNDTVKRAARHDQAVIFNVVDSIDDMVANATAALRDAASKQDGYKADLSRVANLQANDVHNVWIRNNTDKAALVDFKATNVLHWMHKFAARDLRFKDAVRQKFENVNATFADQMMDVINVAHSTLNMEKDQRQQVYNQFETSMREQKEWVKNMVGQVRLSAEDALEYMHASKGARDRDENNENELATEIMRMDNRYTGDDVGTQSLLNALQKLRMRIKQAIYLGTNAGSLSGLFASLKQRVNNQTKVPGGLIEISGPRSRNAETADVNASKPPGISGIPIPEVIAGEFGRGAVKEDELWERWLGA